MSTTLLTYNCTDCETVTWINIVHPTQQDIDELAVRCPQFHPLNLKDCLTDLEYPKLDHHDGYLFLTIQIPFWDAKEKISRPAEVDIFVAHGILVTSHQGELKPLVEMFDLLQRDETARAEWMGSGASPLLYRVLDTLVDYCFPILRKVGDNLRHIEETAFSKDTRHLLFEVALLRRDIIVLRNILRSQQDILQGLIRGSWPFIQDHLDPYWGDISDHLNQICATLDLYAEVIGGLSETIDTLSSHNIDEVMRLLTLTTILSLPVTLLATIFGMNVVMPFNNHPVLFYTIVVIGVGITVWLVMYLRKKGWL